MLDPDAYDPSSDETSIIDESRIADILTEEEIARAFHSTHGGGPSTPAGKARSSQNSLTHGCRSHILIIPGEKQEDYDELLHRWRDACEPDDPATQDLVDQFVLNKWLFLRNERYFLEVSQQLSSFPITKWNEAQHRIYQLATRYKVAAERAASKAQRDLEDYLKNRRAEDTYRQKLSTENHRLYLQLEKATEKNEKLEAKQIQIAEAKGQDSSALKAAFETRKQEHRAKLSGLLQNITELDRNQTRRHITFPNQNDSGKLRRLNILEQWVEVTTKDGITQTQLTPSNQQLIERSQTMDPPPELVYRRVHFPAGIPAEYAWVSDDDSVRKYGGLGVQRMSIPTWLRLIDTEQLRHDSHIGPCLDPLPDPSGSRSRHCPACEENRQLLLARAQPNPEGQPG